ALEGQTGSYYLDRANHTGTQLAVTISDFVPEARNTISVEQDSQQYLQYDSSSGVFTVTPAGVIDVTVDNTWPTMQEWIDNEYVGNESSYQEGDILVLAAANPSESWVRNGTNPSGTAGAGINDWTQLNNDVSDSEIRALFSATLPLEYNNVTGNYSILQSGVSQDGYLSTTDWNIFNDKQGVLTAGDGIDITLDTISLDIAAYTAPAGISMAAASGNNWQLSSDTLIHLETPVAEIKPLATGSDATLKLTPTGTTNVTAIDFYTSADTLSARIFNDENAGILTMTSLGMDLNIQGVGGLVDIQSTTGTVQIQNVSYPDASTGSNGDVLVYDGGGNLSFQNFGGGLTGGDGIDITSSTISVDLSPNGSLSFLSGQLRVDPSIAGSGLTMTTGILSVDYIDLSTSVTGILGVGNGGTGLDSSSASNGQLLIGNGLGYSLSTLTTGSAIDITNGVGSITIDVTANGINITHIDYGVTGNQVNASSIPIIDTAGNYTATNVEDALAEVKDDINNIDLAASNITYDNSVSGLTATDVQTAIDEVEQRVDVNDAKVSADGLVSTHSDVDTTGVSDGDILVYNNAASEWQSVDPSTIGVKRSWTISAGTSNNNVTNRYLNWTAGAHNVSPYIIPLNSTVKYITAGTRISETWTAEVRVNGSVVASLSISGADSGVSTEQSVDVNAGDKITFYCNGNQINRPSMSVLFDER
ncbi:MAG: hypothetical protein ACC656_03150, partial [Candidatus Heimdallarchaeota archaeon]